MSTEEFKCLPINLLESGWKFDRFVNADLLTPEVPGVSDFGRSFNPISTGREGIPYYYLTLQILDLPMALYQASE